MSNVSYYFIFINVLRVFYLTQFILATSAIRVRFKALNSVFKRRNSKPVWTSFSYLDMTKIWEVERIFQQLCDCIDIVNDTFTFQIVFVYAVLLVTFIVWFSVFPHKSLLIVIFLFFQLLDVTSAYGIIHELLKPSEISFFTFCLNGTAFSCHTFLIIIPIYFARAATVAAKTTLRIASKSMKGTRFSDSQKIDMICVLTQMKLRDVNFQNIFFRFDWPILLAVSMICVC